MYDEALVEVLADNDLDLSNLSEESDFYESSDPEESSEEKMPDEKVEDLPDEREEPQQNPVARGVERGVGRGQNYLCIAICLMKSSYYAKSR